MEDAIIRQGECFVVQFDEKDTVFCGKCGIKGSCEKEWRKKQAGEPYHTFEDYQFSTGLVDLGVGTKEETPSTKKKKNLLKDFLSTLTRVFREKIVADPIPIYDPETRKDTGKFVRNYTFNAGPLRLQVTHSEVLNAIRVVLFRGNIEKYNASCVNLDDDEEFKNLLRQIDRELKK